MDDEGIKLLSCLAAAMCGSVRTIRACGGGGWEKKEKSVCTMAWHGMATKASTIFSFFAWKVKTPPNVRKQDQRKPELCHIFCP